MWIQKRRQIKHYVLQSKSWPPADGELCSSITSHIKKEQGQPLWDGLGCCLLEYITLAKQCEHRLHLYTRKEPAVQPWGVHGLTVFRSSTFRGHFCLTRVSYYCQSVPHSSPPSWDFRKRASQARGPPCPVCFLPTGPSQVSSSLQTSALLIPSQCSPPLVLWRRN